MTALLLWLALQTAPVSPHGDKAAVLIFTRTDCPVSNRYAPEIQRLYRKYAPQGVEFSLVYPERDLSAEAMERHHREFGYTMPAILDPGHRYVARARARTTPEAAVFAAGQLVYHGRIDDRYLDFSKSRQQASHHDLDDALGAVLAGKAPPARETSAVGCAIEDLR